MFEIVIVLCYCNIKNGVEKKFVAKKINKKIVLYNIHKIRKSSTVINYL